MNTKNRRLKDSKLTDLEIEMLTNLEIEALDTGSNWPLLVFEPDNSKLNSEPSSNSAKSELSMYG